MHACVHTFGSYESFMHAYTNTLHTYTIIHTIIHASIYTYTYIDTYYTYLHTYIHICEIQLQKRKSLILVHLHNRKVQHIAKEKKITNAGVISFTLHRGIVAGKVLYRYVSQLSESIVQVCVSTV